MLKLTQFPKKIFAKKGKPFRLKCNAGNFQCGGSCKNIAYKNKTGQMAYTRCGKNAKGGAQTGLEWLQYVKSRRQRLKGKFGDKFTVDATGKVIRRRNQPMTAQPKQAEAKPAPKGAVKLPESRAARLTALHDALNQTNALLEKKPTPSLHNLKKRFEKQIDELMKQIAGGKPKPNLNDKKTGIPKADTHPPRKPRAKFNEEQQNTAPQSIREKEGYSLDEQKELDSIHKQNLYGIAMGNADTRSPDTARMQDEAIANYTARDTTLRNKVKKLMESGLTQPEANGITAWISGAYPTINKAIYAPETLSQTSADIGLGAGVRAAEGLRKLKAYTHRNMSDMASIKGKKIIDDGTILRGVKIAGDKLSSFLAPYELAVGKSEYKEPSFLAASAISAHPLVKQANVIYEIKPKNDGTGQGRMVDQYKTDSWEGEVIYPPYSRFRVTKVDKPQQPSAYDIKKAIGNTGFRLLPDDIQAKIESGNVSNEDLGRLKSIVHRSQQYHALKDQPKKSKSPFGQWAAGMTLDKLQLNSGSLLSKKAASTLGKILSQSAQPIKIYMEEL